LVREGNKRAGRIKKSRGEGGGNFIGGGGIHTLNYENKTRKGLGIVESNHIRVK